MSDPKNDPRSEPKNEKENTDGKRTNEEMVRALLKMNPALRQGKSTAEMAQFINQGAAAKPANAPATAPVAVNLVTELETLRVEHSQAKHAYEQERRRLTERQTALDADRKRMRAQVSAQIVGAIRRIDVNLTERKHQVLLQKEKPFLDDIGFSMNALLK